MRCCAKPRGTKTPLASTGGRGGTLQIYFKTAAPQIQPQAIVHCNAAIHDAGTNPTAGRNPCGHMHKQGAKPWRPTHNHLIRGAAALTLNRAAATASGTRGTSVRGRHGGGRSLTDGFPARASPGILRPRRRVSPPFCIDAARLSIVPRGLPHTRHPHRGAAR